MSDADDCIRYAALQLVSLSTDKNEHMTVHSTYQTVLFVQ